MFCRTCGNKLPDDLRVCDVCGNTVETHESAGRQFSAPQKPKGSLAIRIVAPIIIVVILTIIFTFVVFLIIDKTPGDALRASLGASATEAEIKEYLAAFGLDKPLVVRYLRMMTGNCGVSFTTGQQVNRYIVERLPTTIVLLLASLVLSLVFAIPAGIISALNRDKAIDVLLSIISIICRVIPFFLLGYQLVFSFSINLRILPLVGADTWLGYILPVITLSFLFFGFATQTIRATTIRALSTKNSSLFLPDNGINAEIESGMSDDSLLPTIARSGIQFGWLLGGIIVVEMMFAIPGVGRLLLNGLASRDTPVILGSIMTLFFSGIIAAGLFSIAITGVIYGLCANTRKAGERAW